MSGVFSSALTKPALVSCPVRVATFFFSWPCAFLLAERIGRPDTVQAPESLLCSDERSDTFRECPRSHVAARNLSAAAQAMAIHTHTSNVVDSHAPYCAARRKSAVVGRQAQCNSIAGQIVATFRSVPNNERSAGVERLRRNGNSILRLARRHGVTGVRVFGSMARGDTGPHSDVDLLVKVGPDPSPWFPGGLVAQLEELLGRRVQVITERGLDDLLRERVLEEAVSLGGMKLIHQGQWAVAKRITPLAMFSCVLQIRNRLRSLPSRPNPCQSAALGSFHLTVTQNLVVMTIK